MSRTIRAFALVAACGATLSGCGSDDPGAKELEQQTIAEQRLALENQLVGDEQLAKVKPDSPERMLLEYWAAVQYADQHAVQALYAPEVVDAVGADRLNEVVRRVSPTYRTGRPEITRVLRDGNEATVRYVAPSQAAAGKVAPSTLMMRRRGGGWEITYNSALDDELRLSAITSSQNAIRPGSRDYAPAAIAAGDRAAKLQSKVMRPESTTP